MEHHVEIEPHRGAWIVLIHGLQTVNSQGEETFYRSRAEAALVAQNPEAAFRQIVKAIAAKNRVRAAWDAAAGRPL